MQEGYPNALIRALDLHPVLSVLVTIVVMAALFAAVLVATGVPLGSLAPVVVVSVVLGGALALAGTRGT